MKKVAALGLSLLMAGTAYGIPVQFDVSAAANSSSGGVGLDTGIVFSTGDTIDLSVDVNDIWNAGALPRWSNADGLVADLFATGTDESGQAAGTKIGQAFANWSQNGLSAPYGALVGSLGSTFFLLGTSFNGPAPDSGSLQLFYWDSNNGDNSDSIRVTIEDGTPSNDIPVPGPLALIGLGALLLSRTRRRG